VLQCLGLFVLLQHVSVELTAVGLKVADELDADLVSYSCGVGITPASTFGCGAYPSVLHLFVRAKVILTQCSGSWSTVD
jgi:hypothetical protein